MQDVSLVETSHESEEGCLVAHQGAEVVEEERQYEEEEDMVGVIERTETQREQQQDELVGEDKKLDELALEKCSQKGEEEDGSDNSEDEDYSRETSDEEDEDLRPAKRRKTPLPPSSEVPMYRHSPTSIVN
jgi:hypothetical protein